MKISLALKMILQLMITMIRKMNQTTTKKGMKKMKKTLMMINLSRTQKVLIIFLQNYKIVKKRMI